MSAYLDPTLNSLTAIEGRMTEHATVHAKAYRKALSKNGASDDLIAQVNSLLGMHRPLGLAIDAELKDCFERMKYLRSGLVQLSHHDDRWQYCYREYLLGKAEPADGVKFNLKAQKAAIEPNLKRGFDAYLIKFFVEEREGISLRARVIGMQLATRTPTATSFRARRKPSADEVLTATEPLVYSNDPGDVARMCAQFWAPPEIAFEAKQSRLRLNPDQQRLMTEALIARAMMPLDRICFGHKQGKPIMRAVLGQIRARAAAVDILHQYPLQPGGLARLLAGLPVDADGSVAAVPEIQLP